MKNKAVILGANYYIGLSVIRCLGRNGVHTVAIEYQKEGTYGFYSKYLNEKHIAPHYKKNTREFVDFLISYAKTQPYKPVLFPCADPYVEVIDQYLDELSEVYLINQTQQGLWTQLMDKNSLYDIAKAHQVLIPETIRVDEEDLYTRVQSELGYPCIVKPSDSPSFVKIFRKKIFKVHNESELKKALIQAADANLEVFVQRIVPGFDDHMYTYDCYLNQDSKVTNHTTAHKKRQYPINFGASVFTEQIYVEALHEIGKPFLEAVGYKGFAEIEFKKDADNGNYYLIEINVRTTNFNVLLEKVGLNFPYIAYRELTGLAYESYNITESTGRTFVYGFEDLLAIKGYLQTKQLKLGQVIKSLFVKKSRAIIAKDDMIPALVFMGDILKKILNKLTRRSHEN